MTENADTEAARERPARNIIVLSDGTGNSAAALFRTNVWKLYKALRLEDPRQLEHPRQFAFYDNGVGSSSFKPLALIGGVFGVGLARNVRELYAFVCRTYRQGDKIYVFGFSRGAFTVRILVGLILREGIVPFEGDEAKLQRDVRAAYRSYRGGRAPDPKTGKPRRRFATLLGLEIPGRWMRDAIVTLWNRIRGYEPYASVKKRIAHEGLASPRIAFVGVWDTVAAYGLPIHELTVAVDKVLWPLSMPDNDLGERVDRAMHALSLDDERRSFHPELWNEGVPRSDPNKPAPNAGKDERLSQVWFSGVHSDLGGGYPDDAVSYAPLKWIMDGADKAGLRFNRRICADYAALGDENGVVHDSRSGVAGYYRYAPRRIDALAKPQRQEGRRRKVAIERVKIHESALRRIKVGQDGYAPISLPPRFDVVTIDGKIVPCERYLSDDTSGLPFNPQAFAAEREHVYDLVWRRRVVYFSTLIVTLALAALPLIATPRPDGACLSSLCFAAPLLTPLKAVAPGVLAPWLDAFSSSPWWLTGLVLAVALGLYWGGALEGRIDDRMRAVWARVPRLKPASAVPYRPPAAPSAAMLAIQRMRLSRAYRWIMRRLTRIVLPALAFLIAAVFAGMLAIKGGHEIRSSTGWVCRGADDPEKLVGIPAGAPKAVAFDPSDPCQKTGLRLDEGATYRLTFVIPQDAPWRDKTIPAGPHRVKPDDWRTKLIALAVPLRRHWREAWLQPIARVGHAGNDTYVLRPEPSIAPTYGGAPPEPAGKGSRPIEESPHQPRVDDPNRKEEKRPPDTVFASEIVARSTGELFLYVNDGVGFDCFYDNNRGAAKVTIERVVPKLPPPPVARAPEPLRRLPSVD